MKIILIWVFGGDFLITKNASTINSYFAEQYWYIPEKE